MLLTYQHNKILMRAKPRALLVFHKLLHLLYLCFHRQKDKLKKYVHVMLNLSLHSQYKHFKPIKSIFIAKYDKQLNSSEKFNWKDFQTKLPSVPDLPRKSLVAMFRLITGHDCLSGHLFKIGLVTSPQWVLCNKSDVMNINHLTVCEKLKSEVDLVSKYWEATRRMILLSNSEH